MKIVLYGGMMLILSGSACKPTEKKVEMPDLRSNFASLLKSKDSTLTLDSFYFIRLDTMNEKTALIHQRFPFYNIMGRINRQLQKMTGDSMKSLLTAGDMQQIEYLKEEKAYVAKEIDSLNRLIVDADSLTPVGYRAFYKVTINKKTEFIVSDTIPYAISLKMKISDWDRNLEKNIDSLSVGKHLRPRRND